MKRIEQRIERIENKRKPPPARKLIVWWPGDPRPATGPNDILLVVVYDD